MVNQMLRYTGEPSSVASPGGQTAPIAMAWRHHDSSVADPFPKPSEYNASDIAKLREVVIALRKPHPSLLYVAARAFSLKDPKWKEFVQLPNFKGCKVAAGELLPSGSARVTHLSNLVERLEDLPPKTGDMVTAELPCHKVLEDKEKKKIKAKVKAAVDAPGADTQAEKVIRDKGVGKEVARKKRRVRVGNPVHPASEHVSSPIPLNHVKPLKILANEQYVSPNASDEGVRENDDAAFANEGYGNNEGGISSLQTQPSPSRHA
ncbi:hypothetical protein Tco_1463811, partial [Tanacetum coccineum]